MTTPHPPPWSDLLDYTAARVRSAASPLPPLPTSPAALDAATPFLIHRGHARGAVVTPPLRPTPDAGLWWALARATVDPDKALAAAVRNTTRAPLLPRDAYDTVEVWTEGELCALHALWRLANRDARPDWRARVLGALAWHLEHTQPDNATNRPWCIAPFVRYAEESQVPEAHFYAQTLLHNATAGPASATILIAEIIADAADMLRVER